MKTGKLLVQEFNILGNNSIQTIPVKLSSTPYLILFRINDNLVTMQHFIFNSVNSLSIGGKNENK